MNIKSKKNLVWLCIFAVVVGWAAFYVHNRSVRQQRQEQAAKIDAIRHEIDEIREARRKFNAETMRKAGISAEIADGTESLSWLYSDDIAGFCDFIRGQCGRTVHASDVAMWLEEPQIKLLLTADTLYLCNPQVGTVQFWDLSQMDVSAIEWERTTHGDMFIGGTRYHFLEHVRRPFTNAIRNAIVNSQILHRKESELSARLRELEL